MTSTVPVSHHELLLAVAGRVDDDLLAWARELIAVGEEGRAVELLTAALIADRVALPAQVRTALVATGRAVRSVLDVDLALPPARAETATPHVFGSAPPAATTASVTASILDALHDLLDRQLVECHTWLAWRLTPAGSATGPLPHPVVLVELAGETGTGADVLACQLATALERDGVAASVEVFSQDTALPDYHLAAQQAGLLLSAGPAGTRDPVRDGELAAPEHSSDPLPAPTLDSDLASDPDPAVESPPLAVSGRHSDQEATEDVAEPSPALAFRPPVVSAWWAAPETPSSAHPEPEPEPARPAIVEPLPPAFPVSRRAEVAPPASVVESSLELEARPRPRPPAEAPEPASGRPHGAVEKADDPLNGPLREPLLAPLLDPTIDQNDPLGVDGLFISRTAGTGGFDPVPRNIAASVLRAARPEPDPDPAPRDPLGSAGEAGPQPSFAAGNGQSWTERQETYQDQQDPEPPRQRPAAPRDPGFTIAPQRFETPNAPPREPDFGSAPAPTAVPRRPEPAPWQEPNGGTWAAAARDLGGAAAVPAVRPAGRDRPPFREPPHPPGGPGLPPHADRPDSPGSMPGRAGPVGGEPRPRRTTSGPRPMAAPDPEPVTPVTGEVRVDPTQLGLRPDSLERLSPTDRALLARLQNEMGTRRSRQHPARPAPWRPPGPAGEPPRPRPVRADPPDIAG